jgi:hypothetical protein
LSLDLRTVLSPSQVIEIIRNAKGTIDSQIKEIHQEISDANAMSILSQGDKEVLNEEGLPIKDIREDVFRENEGTRAVLAEEETTKKYTMDEIYKMMDEAAAEERAELEALQQKQNTVQQMKEKEKEEIQVDATAGQGLEVGQVSGEELLAKLVDDSKKRYNPIDDTWIEDEAELSGEDDYYNEEHSADYDDDEEEGEETEEEDQYGRTRGYFIPPGLYKGSTKDKGVKFASFEKPAERHIEPVDKPIKSALKKTNIPQSPLLSSSTAPLLSSGMATNIVERDPNRNVYPSYLSLIIGYPNQRYQGSTQNESFQSG